MFTNRQMRNKLRGLKLRYNNCLNLQNSSGLGRNKTTSGVEAEDEWFQPTDGSQDDIQDCSEPDDTTKGAPPPFCEQLDILFGSCPDRGSFMWAGGISESNTPPTYEPAGTSGKRASMDNEVNSPPKKMTCSVEDYMRQISESIVHRSSRERRETREEMEVTQCMEMLIKDDACEGSELYFKALDLFKSSVCRTQYKKMKDPTNNVAWIEWTWTNRKQK